MSFEEIIERLDESTVLTKGLVLDLYRNFGAPQEAVPPADRAHGAPESWRERIWTCPDETQLSVTEFGEAAGRRRSWAYDQARRRTTAPVHHDESGRPYYVAHEVRDWLRVRGEAATRSRVRAR
jgi:hypothetical protein